MKTVSAILEKISVKEFEAQQNKVTFDVDLTDSKGNRKAQAKIIVTIPDMAAKEFISQMRDYEIKANFDIHDIDSPTIKIIFENEATAKQEARGFFADIKIKLDRLKASTAKDNIINQLGIIRMMSRTFSQPAPKKNKAKFY